MTSLTTPITTSYQAPQISPERARAATIERLQLITLYRIVFFAWCGLFLAVALVVGLGFFIAGDTPKARETGLMMALGGLFCSIVFAGNMALALENHELLKRIAEGQGGADSRG